MSLERITRVKLDVGGKLRKVNLQLLIFISLTKEKRKEMTTECKKCMNKIYTYTSRYINKSIAEYWEKYSFYTSNIFFFNIISFLSIHLIQLLFVNHVNRILYNFIYQKFSDSKRLYLFRII